MPLYPYHRQDLSDWCGAACLQMILEKNGLLASQPVQRPLFNAVRDGNNWNASPEKMLTVLNQILPAPNGYELLWRPLNHTGASRRDALDVLAAVKAAASEGVLIPCRDYKHWVVVTGAFTADTLHSQPDQLCLVVNDPWTAAGRECAHGDAACPSGVCGASPELWGPVKVSDFLIQLRRGSLCLAKPATAKPVDSETVTALAGDEGTPMRAEDVILETALKHYQFFHSKFAADLPLPAPDGVDKPRPGSSGSVRVSGGLTSGYHDRWQVRLVDNQPGSQPRFSVWVEMCARTLRLSRVRYVDNHPDWWTAGGAWL